MLEESVVEVCCREVLWRSVGRRVLGKAVGEEVLEKSVVEKCCRELL